MLKNYRFMNFNTYIWFWNIIAYDECKEWNKFFKSIPPKPAANIILNEGTSSLSLWDEDEEVEKPLLL